MRFAACRIMANREVEKQIDHLEGGKEAGCVLPDCAKEAKEQKNPVVELRSHKKVQQEQELRPQEEVQQNQELWVHKVIQKEQELKLVRLERLEVPGPKEPVVHKAGGGKF